jgi:hypothetical protein
MCKKEDILDGFKLFKLKAKHYLHRFCHRIQLPYICFIISIALSLFILFPSLFHSIPILEMANQNGIFQYKLSLSGRLLFSDDASVQYPIRVSAGGYSEQIMEGAEFSLTFLSATRSDIPIVISDESGRYVLEYITFGGSSFVTTFCF